MSASEMSAATAAVAGRSARGQGGKKHGKSEHEKKNPVQSLHDSASISGKSKTRATRRSEQ
jgi:hypothetical protein